MKTKLNMMDGPEIDDVIRALFRWFESQDIPPYNAFLIVSQATGTMLGRLSKDEKELERGFVAVQKDMKITAKNNFREKMKRR